MKNKNTLAITRRNLSRIRIPLLATFLDYIILDLQITLRRRRNHVDGGIEVSVIRFTYYVSFTKTAARYRVLPIILNQLIAERAANARIPHPTRMRIWSTLQDMTKPASSVAACLMEVCRHLGIEQAQIAAAQMVSSDWLGLATEHAERLASLTLLSLLPRPQLVPL